MDIQKVNIVRHGTWKVIVDNVEYSSHNEEKEGYENLLEAIIANPTADVKLVPDFYTTMDISKIDNTVDIEAIKQKIIDSLSLESNKEYSLILFESNDNMSDINVIDTTIIKT